MLFNTTCIHLIHVFQNGSVSCCQQLTAADPEQVNATDYSGKSPLHYAAAAGNVQVIKQLAAMQGCDLMIEDPDDR